MTDPLAAKRRLGPPLLVLRVRRLASVAVISLRPRPSGQGTSPSMLLVPLLAVLGVTPAPARFDAQGRAVGAPLSERTASYVLEARLDPAARQLQGRAVLTWTNRSGAPQRVLWFHAYWNAFRDASSSFVRERAWSGGTREDPARFRAADHGWMDLTSARLPEGTELLPSLRWEHPDDDNAADRTVFTLTLPSAVEPQGTVTLDLRWDSRVPRLAARSGALHGFYFLRQGFPKLAVPEGPPPRGVRAPTRARHAAAALHQEPRA